MVNTLVVPKKPIKMVENAVKDSVPMRWEIKYG